MKTVIFEKSLKVKEPECWYGKCYITASLFLLSNMKTVRVMLKSIDDFAVYQDVDDWDARSNQEWAKKYLWDNLPDSVSLNWLYQHGYKPF